MSAYESPDHENVDGVAEQLAADVKRGARRAKNAVRDAVADGAASVEDAVRPRFHERLLDGIKSVTDEPSRFVEQARDLVRDYPLASVATVAVASLAIARLFRR